MEYCVRYHIVDDENKVLKTFYGSVEEKKLKTFLDSLPTIFRKAFENGKKNSQILLTNGRKETIDFEIIPVQTEEELLLEKMKSEKNAFGRYINFLEGISDMENVYQYHSNRSFSLNCLSDEGDLYTYQVLISFPKLYQFITYLNQNYKVIKEETFLELDWDCYENKPILSKVLAQDSAYCLLDFHVEKENIDIRTQKATNVYVKWEESVALFRYINTMVSSLTQRTQVDWSTIPEEFDALAVDKQEKKQLYYNFLSCFQFGDPIEIIPSHIVSQIEEHSSHPTLSLEQQKRILEKRKKLGIRNREFFALLLEKDMVSFPKQLVSKNAKF